MYDCSFCRLADVRGMDICWQLTAVTYFIGAFAAGSSGVYRRIDSANARFGLMEKWGNMKISDSKLQKKKICIECVFDVE
jgi:hypothetical protein